MFKVQVYFILFLLSPWFNMVCCENINILMIRDQLPLVNIHIPEFETITSHKVRKYFMCLEFKLNFILTGEFD
jgi:hypothetical protein